TVPIKSDKEVKEDQIKAHHVLLVGRPDSNTLVARFQAALPVTFGKRSFTVRHETYAYAGSAVVAAADNPLNPRYSMVVLAGLNAESTLGTPPALLSAGRAEVLILTNRDKPRALVVPARELVRKLKPNGSEKTGISSQGSGLR